MWIFDKRVAQRRSTYMLAVKIFAHSDPDVSGRREGHILADEEPLSHPIPLSIAPQVRVRYRDRRKKECTEWMPVAALRTTSKLKTGCKLLVIKGDRIGQVLDHLKTEVPLARVCVEGAPRTGAFHIEIANICVIESSP